MDTNFQPTDEITYFTGERCHVGHASVRYKSNGDCMECSRARNRKRWNDNAALINQRRRDRYKNDQEHREKINTRNRQYLDVTREAYNESRRLRRKNDEAYREKQKIYRKGFNQRPSQIKLKYGLTLESYNAMLADQAGKCAICSEEFSETPCVDHCHATLKVRALLCRKCNTGLGSFRDNTGLLALASDYLRRHAP